MSEQALKLIEQGFTPVEEALPDVETLCLIATATSRILGILDSEGKWRGNLRSEIVENVLAWKAFENYPQRFIDPSFTHTAES
jgi:hypothetical protein